MDDPMDEELGPGAPPGDADDPFRLPDDMPATDKRLFMSLLEQVMSQALREPDRPRTELLAVVDLLAARLHAHWGEPPG